MKPDSMDKLVEGHPIMEPAWRELKARIAATPQSVAPPAISCTEMGRVLAEELAEAESQMKAHFKDQQYHYWEGVCNGIETCIDALQLIGKHSKRRRSGRCAGSGARLKPKKETEYGKRKNTTAGRS